MDGKFRVKEAGFERRGRLLFLRRNPRRINHRLAASLCFAERAKLFPLQIGCDYRQ
jgi:hypothetical protein